MSDPINRRDAIKVGAAGVGVVANAGAAPPARASERPFLTCAANFTDVSRGDPLPHTLRGEALVKARLTPAEWRLEIGVQDSKDAPDKAKVERPLSIASCNALTFAKLEEIGRRAGVRFLKAMQCQNIAFPLGQGLWEGVPLREVLKLCGKVTDARRVYYWGYHNDKPEQRFQSSLAFSQVFDSPPGDLAPFLAYRLNGGPIPLERGGPVRMIVPWAHGFKSVKWLQHIVLTNDFRANDTYARDGNDPESYLKTAAYFDDKKEQAFPSGREIEIRGTAMVGLSGLARVEYWIRPQPATAGKLADDDPAWDRAVWKPAVIEPPPTNWGEGISAGAKLKGVHGFDDVGRPKEWPLRYSIAHWTVTFAGLKPGKYELRVRTVDQNGFAQPQPRPGGRTGMNRVESKVVVVR